MALLSISAAARAVGKDRTTLHRKLKSGELSATTGPDGSKLIDTSELIRVFGQLSHAVATQESATGEAQQAGQTPKPAIENGPDPAQMALIEMLRGQLAQASEREQWLREQLEVEQHTRRELEVRLLPAPSGTRQPAQPASIIGPVIGLVVSFLVAVAVALYLLKSS